MDFHGEFCVAKGYTNIANCAHLKHHITTCGDLWPFCEDPVCPNPARKLVGAIFTSPWRITLCQLYWALFPALVVVSLMRSVFSQTLAS